jgi:hypothetical protein
MMNRSVAAVDRAISVPESPEPRIVPLGDVGSGELRPPLALWVYVARGMGRIILSVLALPFV